MSIDDKIVRMILETNPSNVNEIVILPAVKLVMKRLVNNLQNKRVNGLVYNGLLNGVRVSIIRSQIGCPNAANTFECLRRTKAKIVVRVDFCGGISNKTDNINVGNLLIPNLAYFGDGTSPYYLIKHPEIVSQLKSIENPINFNSENKAGNQKTYYCEPDNILKNILLNTATNMFSNTKEADFWTTDALFCETNELIDALKSINVEGIDMENSILFLLGKLYNLKTASILSVSDLPGHQKYDMFKTNEIHPDMENGINNAINVVINSLPKIKDLLKV